MSMIEFSILCLERWDLEEELEKLIPHMDSVHLDIMDGEFVPNTAFTVDEVNKMHFDIPKHIHIMANEPHTYIEGIETADTVTFHIESDSDAMSTIKAINAKGFGAGICINPETTIESIAHLLPHLERVLVMAVRPGFSGQKYIPETSSKIVELRQLSADISIVIDGGMHEDTIREVMTIGADACVVCSVIVKSGGYGEKVAQLKASGEIGSKNRMYLSNQVAHGL